jgi:hypothetical protein
MWWQYVIAAVVVIVAVCGFVSLTRFETGWLTRKTDRTAEDMYDSYAGSPRNQHRHARDQDAERRDE